MNNSNLFSTDEFSLWSPEVVKQVLCIPEEQLSILSAIPGWNEVQRQCNTLRIEKDFPLENSQFLNSVSNSQNNRLVSQHNLELFEKHQEERKNILKKKSQKYIEKLSRSESLFYLDNIEENLLSDCSLKRVSSLPTLSEFSDILIEDTEFVNSSKTKSLSITQKQELPISRQAEYSTIFEAKKVTVPEPEKSEELFCSSDIGTKVMEVETHLPINISSHVLKPAVQAPNSEVVYEKDDSLPVQIKENCPSNLNSDPLNLVFHLPKDPVYTEKVGQDSNSNNDLLAKESVIKQSKSSSEPTSLVPQLSSHIEAAEELSSDVPTSSGPQLSSNIEVALVVSSDVPVEKDYVVSAKKHTVDAQCVTANLGVKSTNSEDLAEENISKIPKMSTTLVSSETKNLDYLANREKIPVEVCPETVTKENPNTFIPELQSSTIKSVESVEVPEERKVDTTENGTLDKPQIDITSKIDHSKNNVVEDLSNDKEAAIKMENSGKRKLDSKNRRSKKLKSEETKRGKIRSLRNVGEVHYHVEDIKAMLDILKQFF